MPAAVGVPESTRVPVLKLIPATSESLSEIVVPRLPFRGAGRVTLVIAELAIALMLPIEDALNEGRESLTKLIVKVSVSSSFEAELASASSTR